MRRIFKIIAWVVIAVVAVLALLSYRSIPAKIQYGVSFSKFHSDELQVDWKQAFLAILDDLKVRHFRLSAHWPMIEPKDGQYDFAVLDFQMSEAAKRGADVVLAVGRRLPGWPECHDPDWAASLGTAAKQQKILDYVSTVVTHYRSSPALKYWQMENEPFLRFATEHCEPVDPAFLAKEISLIRTLDPAHQILVTDGGEFGSWSQARSAGDLFGTSLYLYIWSSVLGYVRYPITPAFFRIKQNLFDLFAGKKPSILIELGAEPWLTEPIINASVSEQLDRMSADRLREVISFASQTGFSEQYLWGAEWWYWMKQHGHPEFWDIAKALFAGGVGR